MPFPGARRARNYNPLMLIWNRLQTLAHQGATALRFRPNSIFGTPPETLRFSRENHCGFLQSFPRLQRDLRVTKEPCRLGQTR